MAVPNNQFQNVVTWQRAELAFLLNSFCAISLSNKKFKDFNNLTANLGDTVSFDLAPRFITTNGLVVTDQPSVQRVQTLSCTQAVNVTSSYTDQQFIFNAEDYMDVFGMSAIKQLGSTVEIDLLKNIVSGVVVSDPQNANFGVRQTNSGPYRFFGDGVTQINSSGQLAQAIANFESLGFAKDRLRGLLPVDIIPSIVQTNLNQFVMNRNNEQANSWELGKFAGCDWYTSNLLPTHIAGTIGDASGVNNIMTVVSTNDVTGANVTQITFTEPTGSTIAGAIKAGDLMVFEDGISGKPNMRALTWMGQAPTQLPVQFVATADAATVSGTVTVTLRTATNIGLVSVANQNQNINNAIQAGMKVKVMPSHRAGLIWSGDQFYMAMPQLPDMSPYYSERMTDKDSGASIRHYWGNTLGTNIRRYVRDCIWGSTLVPETCMRILIPIS
jgi:hypothetical protein